MIRHTLPLVSVLFAIAGCAATPKQTPVQIGEALKTATVRVAPVERPIRLSERTKAQAVGGVVLGSVLGVALGGGNVEASGVFAQTATQVLPDSYRIANGAGADLALAKKFSERFAASAGAREFVLSVEATKWELGYVSFMTSQDYALTYQFQIHLAERADNKLNKLATVQCGNLLVQNRVPQWPHETWTADSYKALDTEAGKIVEDCYGKALIELGLG